MRSELRRAAEAVVADYNRLHVDNWTGDHRGVVDALDAALSAPDELAEAREIIEDLMGFAAEYGEKNVLHAREFLKRTAQ
jgi:hypothetical protein